MGNWKARVKIKHLLNEDESLEAVRAAMNAIADVLEAPHNRSLFVTFDTGQFRMIPEGDSFFSPIDYANRCLDRLYDYADAKRIWIA